MTVECNPIDPWSTDFVNRLVRKFGPELSGLLARREANRKRLGGVVVAALVDPVNPEVKGLAWRCAPAPDDLLDRRVEITGPGVEAKMVLGALNSGASGYMVDGEDSLCPTWDNVLATQSNLSAAVRRALRVEGRELVAKPATLHYRPRGLHLAEAHLLVDGEEAPAALVDFGLFAWCNAAELVRRGSGPYLYLPKLESELEAAWWDRVMAWTEDELSLSRGTFRCTVLVETLPALLRLESIVWELRGRLTGLNVGRWDYIFSCLKTLSPLAVSYVLPDREELTMATPQLAEYARWVVNVAHRRGCHAIGGMAANVPNRRDSEATRVAMEAVEVDKSREVSLGHDGTWVAHPDLVSVALRSFERGLQGFIEQRRVVPGPDVLNVELVCTPVVGRVTWGGVRRAARSALLYLDAWLGGNGCVAIDGKMEDAATAEISRALLWSWACRGVQVDGGEWVGGDKVVEAVRGEAGALAAAGAEPRAAAVELLIRSIVGESPEFITVPAYDILVKRQ